MYLGKAVELAENEQLYSHPRHPYTGALLSAVPVPDPELAESRQRDVPPGDVPSPTNSAARPCRFHPAAPAQDVCAQVEPELESKGHTTLAACHFPAHPRRGRRAGRDHRPRCRTGVDWPPCRFRRTHPRRRKLCRMRVATAAGIGCRGGPRRRVFLLAGDALSGPHGRVEGPARPAARSDGGAPRAARHQGRAAPRRPLHAERASPIHPGSVEARVACKNGCRPFQSPSNDSIGEADDHFLCVATGNLPLAMASRRTWPLPAPSRRRVRSTCSRRSSAVCRIAGNSDSGGS